MSTVLYYIIPFIIVLGILIFFHEFGHFLLAKLFKVMVLKFSLGFGPKLIGKKVGETEYVISALPLGGYVKMLGENEDDEADEAGILKGDLIEYIEDKKIDEWKDIRKFIEKSSGKGITMVIMREGKRISTIVFPKEETVKNIFGEEIKSPLIGIVASGNIEKLQLNPFQAIKKAGEKTWEITYLTFLTIVKLFQGVVPLKTLGGPIMIGQLTGNLARENVSYLFPLMAVISINLAILNLLPVPVLDGGMILFCLIEMLIRKPISIRKREMAQKIGFFILILLMAIVFYNDLLRIITK
jgi:regulator of sigma E protease